MYRPPLFIRSILMAILRQSGWDRGRRDVVLECWSALAAGFVSSGPGNDILDIRALAFFFALYKPVPFVARSSMNSLTVLHICLRSYLRY